MKSILVQIKKRQVFILISILVLNFILRLLIYSKTTLFGFLDYKAYFEGVDKIGSEGNIPLFKGNFLFTLSYLGYYFKYQLGSIQWFFILNSLLGTMITGIMSLLTIKVSDSISGGILVAVLLTIYPEFMVFSSVFYSTIIMLALLSLFIFLLFGYYRSENFRNSLLKAFLLFLIYSVSFLFKPELVFVPVFFLISAFLFLRKDKMLLYRTLSLSITLALGFLLIILSGLYRKAPGNIITNDFVFFGHTDYGGDGGEGAFVYPENKARYELALKEYCQQQIILSPVQKDINAFQAQEVRKFITRHPVKWAGLQFTKFFRTFGVVPETTSFKVLYTGLFKRNLWFTSIVMVAPVALIIILFILFFNLAALKKLFNKTSSPPPPLTPSLLHPLSGQSAFLIIYLTLFIYYIIATIFFGQYQERYRMPLMILFIIPALGYFISAFDKREFLKRRILIIKGVVILLFLTVWTFQARKAISNTERLENAIEAVSSIR